MNNPDPMTRLTTDQAAETLGVTRRRLQQLIDLGRLPALREETPRGPIYRIEAEDLAAFAPLASGRQAGNRCRKRSIPEDVLARMVEHRPHLARMAENLRQHPEWAGRLERDLATNYLRGTVKLSPVECMRLGSCAEGRAYGE